MTKTNIPQEIGALIQIAEEEQATNLQQQNALKAVEEEKGKQERNAEAMQIFGKVRHFIPDVISQYTMFCDDLLAMGFEGKWYEKTIGFQIPGLAPFAMVFEGFSREGLEVKLSKWVVSGVSNFEWESETDLCKKAGFSFRSAVVDEKQADKTNIRQVLWAAKKTFEDKEARQVELDQAIAQYHKREEKRGQEKARAEEESLFAAIKNDPIVVHMLKAFVLLHDERSTFEQHIEEMSDEMYGMEDRWSRKAADLRRQADEYQRHAEDEKSRLQSDLDDAESKLKNAKRGW